MKRRTVALGVLVSVMLLLATLIKPNFALFFLPAAAAYVLIIHFRSLTAWWRSALLVAPTLAILASQYFFFYGEETGSDKGIGIEFLKVWRPYSPNVAISILLAVAFPLSILIYRPRQSLKDPGLFLAWICFAVALAQAALFFETVSDS